MNKTNVADIELTMEALKEMDAETALELFAFAKTGKVDGGNKVSANTTKDAKDALEWYFERLKED